MSNQVKDQVEVDLHFEGFNFVGGLIALAAVKAGLRVAITVDKPVDHAFRPELSQTYPVKLSESRSSLANIQFLLKCSSFFPQLYFPKRVLMLQTNSKLNSSLTTVFDQLLGRDRDMATLSANTRKLTDYSIIDEELANGNLVFEYQFDRNRAIVDLLFECAREGVLMNDTTSAISAKYSLMLKPFQHKLILKQVKMEYSYPNPISLKNPDFELTFNPQLSGVIIQLNVFKRNNEAVNLVDKIRKVFEQLKLDFSDEIISWLKEISANLNSSENKNESIIYDSSLNNLRTEINQLQRKINRQLSVKINLQKIFSNDQNNAITGEQFRILQSECDEKFDLAKQTGIEYWEFSRLFYRYRFQIDEMIDEAYELMNKERDPQLIWQQVVITFLKNEEHKLQQLLNNIRW